MSASTLFGPTAIATAATPDTEAEAATGLTEIVVTATRREENINKVPISITALSQDALDQKGIRDFTELVRFTPGVSIDQTGTNAISIRGISSSGGAGTTGIYIDDTPIQMRSVGFNPDDTLPKTFDLDRVEVLRGPQGTLFGSGSEGGTVRYIMTQPKVTGESTYARSETSYTEYGDPNFEVGVAHGEPIVDGVLGYRASVWYRYDGGYINRVDETTGKITEPNANYAGTVAARLAMLYKPAENVNITPSFMFQNKQQHDLSTYWPPYSNPGAGRFNNATPETIPIADAYYLPALRVQIDFEHMTFFSNSSYYHRDETDSYQGTGYDLAYYQSLGWPPTINAPTAQGLGCGSGLTLPSGQCSWYPLLNGTGVHLGDLPAQFQHYATPNKMTNQQRSWVQEFRLQSTDDASRWKWTAGTFWTLAETLSLEQLNDPQIMPFFAYLFAPQPGFQTFNTDAYFGPYYACNGQGTPNWWLPYPKVPDCDIYYNYNKVYDRQLAGFGEVTYKLTDRFSLTAGGRYAKMDVSLNHYSTGYENFGPSANAGTTTEHSFTPKASVTFQANDNNLFYATYAKGFRPGGYNPPLPAASCSAPLMTEGYPSGQPPFTYNSDTTQSYEIGSKNNIAERFRIASSVYYIKWDQIQQNVYVAGGCGLQFTDNLGTAVVKGFDLQADAVIGGGLSVEASVGYTDARFTATNGGTAATGFRAVDGDAISGQAAINYSPGTNPPWNIAIGPQYDFRVMDHDAFVRMDWTYASRNGWLAPVQDPRSSQFHANSYTLPATSYGSFRVGFKAGNWQFAAFCDNLLNSYTTLNYAQVQVDAYNPSFNRFVPSSLQQNNFTYRPRTFGITTTFKM